MSEQKYLRIEQSGSTAHIFIDRPEKQNAFDTDMWIGLSSLCEKVASSNDCKSLVLRSTSTRFFCSGADISQFEQFQRDSNAASENALAIRAAFDNLRALPIPTIARIEGNCFGGGVALALACDFRLAGTGSKFAITPAKLGLNYAMQDVNTLIQTVGLPMARRMLLLAETLNSDTALKSGLIDSLAEDSRTLDQLVDQMIGTINGLSSNSLRTIKEKFTALVTGQEVANDDSHKQFVDAFAGPHLEEGMAAFLQKRKPEFPDH